MATKGMKAENSLERNVHPNGRSMSAWEDAEIERIANSDTFPELHMDEDTIREVKASWIMFVQSKGSVEAAEDAICKQLHKVDSPFAQLLYPDRKNKAKAGRKNKDDVDGKTGQRVNQDTNRQYAEIMRAAADPRDGGGGGGGCPFAGGGGGGGRKGDDSNFLARGGMQASIFEEDFDKKEFAEVMKKVFAAQAAAKAAGEDVAPGQKAQKRQASRDVKRTPSSTPKDRARGTTPTRTKATVASTAERAAPTTERRALTPSGKSSAESRRVSL